VAEVLVHRGEPDLFADDGLPSYDRQAAASLVPRAPAFLERVG